MKTRFTAFYAAPTPTTSESFAALMASELKKYELVVKASGAKAD